PPLAPERDVLPGDAAREPGSPVLSGPAVAAFPPMEPVPPTWREPVSALSGMPTEPDAASTRPLQTVRGMAPTVPTAPCRGGPGHQPGGVSPVLWRRPAPWPPARPAPRPS